MQGHISCRDLSVLLVCASVIAVGDSNSYDNTVYRSVNKQEGLLVVVRWT